MFEAERRNDDGIDRRRVARFDLDPLPSQWGRLFSSSSSNEAEYWEHHSHSQEARKKKKKKHQPSFAPPTPPSSELLPSSNGDGLRASEPERRRLTLRPPRPPPPLDPNLAPAANYLKSRFGPNPFPYPDPEDAPIYFPASSGKLLAVKPQVDTVRERLLKARNVAFGNNLHCTALCARAGGPKLWRSLNFSFYGFTAAAAAAVD